MSIKEALAAARQFVEHAPGSNAKATLVKIDAALAQLESADARERIADAIAGELVRQRGSGADLIVGVRDDAECLVVKGDIEILSLATAILATDLVPDEAAIRADEREKCAKNDLLNVMEAECWSLRCFNIPTGGDDYDVGWEVVEHHMAKPHDRRIGFGGTPREALAAAIRSGGEDQK